MEKRDGQNENTNDTRRTGNDANSTGRNDLNSLKRERPSESERTTDGEQFDLFAWARSQQTGQSSTIDSGSSAGESEDASRRNIKNNSGEDSGSNRRNQRSSVDTAGGSNLGNSGENSRRRTPVDIITHIRENTNDGVVRAFLEKYEIKPDNLESYGQIIAAIIDQSDKRLSETKDSKLKLDIESSLTALRDKFSQSKSYNKDLHVELITLELRFNQLAVSQKNKIDTLCKDLLPIEYNNNSEITKKDLFHYLNQKLRAEVTRLAHDKNEEYPDKQLIELGFLQAKMALVKRYFHEVGSLPTDWFYSDKINTSEKPEDLNTIHSLVSKINEHGIERFTKPTNKIEYTVTTASIIPSRDGIQTDVQSVENLELDLDKTEQKVNAPEGPKEPIEFPSKATVNLPDFPAFSNDMIPEGYTSAIIAEYDQNDSDLMTDYHSHKTLKTIVVGLSKSNRISFPEMRKAGLKSSMPAIREVAKLDKDKEHRENYSMGAGYYLKDGHSNADGWSLTKVQIPFGSHEKIEYDPTALKNIISLNDEHLQNENSPIEIQETKHTQKGHDLFVVQLPERVDKDEFKELIQEAKKHKGYYSSFSKNGALPGFQFKSKSQAEEFVGLLNEKNNPDIDEFGVDWGKIEEIKAELKGLEQEVDVNLKQIQETSPKEESVDYLDVPAFSNSQVKSLNENIKKYFNDKATLENRNPHDTIRVNVRNFPKSSGKRFSYINARLHRLLDGELDKKESRAYYLKSAPYKLLCLDVLVQSQNLSEQELVDILSPGPKQYIGDNLLILSNSNKGEFRKVFKNIPDELSKLVSIVKDPNKLTAILNDVKFFIEQRIKGEGDNAQSVASDIPEKLDFICASNGIAGFKNIKADPLFSSSKELDTEIPEIAPITNTPPVDIINSISEKFQNWIDLRNSGEFPVGNNIRRATFTAWLETNFPNWVLHEDAVFEKWQNTLNEPKQKNDIEYGQELFEANKNLIKYSDKGIDLSEFYNGVHRDSNSIKDHKIQQNSRTRASLYAHGLDNSVIFISDYGWVEADLPAIEEIELPAFKKGFVSSNHVSIREYPNGFGAAYSVDFDNGGSGFAPVYHNDFLFKTKEQAVQHSCDLMLKKYSTSDSKEAKFYTQEIKKVKTTHGKYLGKLFDDHEVKLKDDSEQHNELNIQNEDSSKQEATSLFYLKDDFIPKGQITRTSANIEAIKTLKLIESEKRPATEPEKIILSKYVGWGGIKNIFKLTDVPDNLKSHSEELKNILTPEEWESAASSVLNAHYTSPEIVKQMWESVSKMNFQGGDILEPACGTGYFIGLCPPEIREKSKFTVVECDSISARITKVLYPEVNLHESLLEKAPLLNAHFDLVIGNVPFLETPHMDVNYPKMHLHDYFLNKGIDLVRPGGVVQVITTKASLDSSRSLNSRKFLNKKSQLLSGVRLPWTAFKANAGAEVTTDILTFQRKKNIHQPALNQFTSSVEETFTNKNDSSIDVTMNEYYFNNPEMVLGHIEHTRGRFNSHGETNVVNADFDASQISRLMYQKHSPLTFDAINSKNPGWAETKVEATVDELNEKNYSFLIKDDIVYQKIGYDLVVHEAANKTEKSKERAKDFISLSKLVNKAIQAQIDPSKSEQVVEQVRLELVDEFEYFEKKWKSPWHRTNKNLFYSDPDYPLLLSLQKEKVEFDKNKKRIFSYEKTGLLIERTCFPQIEPKSVDSINDAVNLSMFHKGSINVEFIAKLMSTTESDANQLLLNSNLAYLDPETNQLVDKETYLSGNVRQKLHEAQVAASKADGIFEINVEHLKSVQPKRIDIDKIEVQLNSTWLPPEIVRRFLKKVTNSDSDLNYVKFNPAESKWEVDYLPYNAEFATDRVQFKSIVSCALNMKSPKVEDAYFEDGKRYTKPNEQETLAAIQKVNELKESFLDFLYSDKKLCDEVEEVYNNKFNSHKIKEFSTYGITHYPGANTRISPREYQIKAINRGIRENTLLAHAVGAGKTLEMITISQEKKRLGLSTKNLIVVQNATVPQFAAEYKKLYPNANILAPLHEKEYRAGNRKIFLSRIASNNWDAVIIPHSFFDLIKDDIEIVKSYYNELKSEYRMSASFAGTGQRDIEKALKKIDLEMEQYTNDKTDDTLSFGELGVDCIMVDEVHAFKKVGIATKMDAIKGLDISSSKKARKLMMKIRAVNSVRPNNIITATGTPVTNTLAEIHSQMRIINEPMLAERGLKSFDDFASAFTLPQDEVELTATNKLKLVKRLSSFTNVGTLVELFSQCADVMTSRTLDKLGCLSKPNIIGGKYESVLIDQNPLIENLMSDLHQKLEDFQQMSGAEKKKNRHIPLLVFGHARQIAVDPRIRLGNSEKFDDPDSKVNKVVEEVYKIYQESYEDKASQMIFSDIYQSSDKSFNLFQDMRAKLISKGINEDEIAIIHDFKTNSSREKLFSDVNEGKVRVLMGTTEKMGVGVNAQERLIALHHMDAPWMPMQLEQRNGRILRHGNMFANKEGVYIKQYGVEKTMDAVIFQRLLQKQKFIESVLEGDVNEQKIEDVAGEMTFSAEEATAIFSGKPGMIEKFKLEKEIEQLKKVQSSWHRQIINTKQDIPVIESRIDKLNSNISDMKNIDISDLLNWQDKDEYSLKYGSITLTEKPSKLLEEPIKDTLSLFNAFRDEVESKDIVKIDNVEFLIKAKREDELSVLSEVILEHKNTGLSITSPTGNSSTLVRKIASLKERYQSVLENFQKELETAKNRLASMKEFVNQPWKKADLLKNKNEQLLALVEAEQQTVVVDPIKNDHEQGITHERAPIQQKKKSIKI